MGFNLNSKHTIIRKSYVGIISLLLLISALVLTYCIDPFNPDVSEDANLLTVDASLIKGREIQKITISKSASLDESGFSPVINCNVMIVDGSGNVFNFEEGPNGIYTARIDDDRLVYNSTYQLIIETANGARYESSHELLYESPPVDSIYFKEEMNFSLNANMEVYGLRLYIDLKAKEEGTRYFRWTIDDVWESRTPFQAITAYLGDTVFIYDPTDSTNTYNPYDTVIVFDITDTALIPVDTLVTFTPFDTVPVFKDVDEPIHNCWDSSNINGLYTANTLNLLRNEKKKIPLHFTTGRSIKLRVKYSCRVI